MAEGADEQQTDVAGLLALTVATLAGAGAPALAAGVVRPAWTGAACAGPARTVACAPGDNLAVHVAVASARPGEVLVVVTEGEPHRGYWGEVLTVAAQARGAAGLVIAACVRDVAALERRRFPVFASGTAVPNAAKVGPGAVGAPVEIGGQQVATGDLVVADVDGVVVLPAAQVDELVAAARDREASEGPLMDALAGGATTIELLGLERATTSVEVRDG